MPPISVFGPKASKVDLNKFLGDVGKWGLSLGIGSAVAGGVGVGAGKVLEKIEDSFSRKENKQKILKMKPELTKVPKERFDAMYNTVQRLGFADDPLFASEAMKRLYEMPESVVGLVPELMRARAGAGKGGGPQRLSEAFREATKRPMVSDLEPINE